MRKEWEERVKRWREMQERNDDDDREDWRHHDDDDWDKQRKMEEWRRDREKRSEAFRKAVGAWIERMQEARERSRDGWDDRDRKDWDRRGHDDDRGEQMRKEWEERMKRWREMRIVGVGQGANKSVFINRSLLRYEGWAVFPPDGEIIRFFVSIPVMGFFPLLRLNFIISGLRLWADAKTDFLN